MTEKHRQQYRSLVTKEMARVMEEVTGLDEFVGIAVDTLANPGDEYDVPYGPVWNRDNHRKPVVRDGMLQVAVTDRLGNNRLGEFQREVGRRLAKQSSSGKTYKK